ncbi:hypothetical protein BCM02_11536 [Paenibacillus methanolicus]|uniref:Uncharacterized protein n=1 Tax=Paenibacillus methanolicus TaxID=582686 RepID=A0A5S5BSU7_9BACL|nr:hypothetical protein BCM02_11536 [Paenibacillus methanolicus]
MKRQYILTSCKSVIGMEGPGDGEILIYTLFQ